MKGSHVHMHSSSPVMESSSGVLAAPHFDHEQREEQEKDSHGEADAVHGPVANQHVTVDVAPNAREGRGHAVFTEAWNLSKRMAPTHTPAHIHTDTNAHTFFSCSSMPGISIIQATPTPSSRKRA